MAPMDPRNNNWDDRDEWDRIGSFNRRVKNLRKPPRPPKRRRVKKIGVKSIMSKGLGGLIPFIIFVTLLYNVIVDDDDKKDVTSEKLKSSISEKVNVFIDDNDVKTKINNVLDTIKEKVNKIDDKNTISVQPKEKNNKKVIAIQEKTKTEGKTSDPFASNNKYEDIEDKW